MSDTPMTPWDVDAEMLNDWKAQRKEITDLRARLAFNVCDACGGTGTPISGHPCMCRGTGRMDEAARYLREQLVDAEAHLAVVEARKDAYREQTEMQATEIKKLIEQKAAAEAERDAWKNAIVDAAVVSWVYRKEHDNNPRLAVNDLLAWTTQVALDPAVSKPIAKLIAERDQLRAELEKKNARDMAS